MNTSDSYYNHDDFPKSQTQFKGFLSQNPLTITYSMTRLNGITQTNPENKLAFSQGTQFGLSSQVAEKVFDLGNSPFLLFLFISWNPVTRSE
jgi:hypothetical protein